MLRSHSTNFERNMPSRSQSDRNISLGHTLQNLDLSKKNITEFPMPNPLVKSLDASSNSLTSLTDQMIEALLSYNRLTTLNLSDNLLTEFPNELNELKHLEKLNFFYNRFQIIDISIPTLTNLNLGQNRLTAIPHLPPNLQTLSFDFNLLHHLESQLPLSLVKLSLVLTELESISDKISLPNLTHLDLSKNNLAALPDLMKLAPKLEVLDVSDNFLPEMPMPPLTIREYIIKSNLLLELPQNLSSLVNLRSLDVSNNHIEIIPALPPSIVSFIFSQNEVSYVVPCKTPRLKRLYLRNNKLSEFPQYEKIILREYTGGFNYFSEIKPLWYLDELIRIDFTHNNLSEIPSFIFKIPMLSILMLSKNKIRTIPADIVKLKRLVTLNLSENPIESLPILPQRLMSLYVGFCHLRELPDMSGNEFLEIFDAPGNNLNMIPNAPGIKTLILSRNRLTVFPKNIPLKIVCLDFSFNFITKLPNELRLQALEELDLSYNSINELPKNFIFPQIKFLKLSSNPIEAKINVEKFNGLEICDITNTRIEFEAEPNIRQLFVTRKLPQYRSRHVKKMSSLQWLAFCEMKGARDQMEDSIATNAFINGDVDLYIVADGHGGCRTSAFSTLFLVDDLSKPGLKMSKKHVYQAIHRLNRALRSRMFTDGSTLAMALFNGKKLITAHIGDSRILVISKDGKVSFVTIDHKSTDRGEYERIHLNGGRISSNRIQGILAPGRSLGDFVVPGKTDEPDIKIYNVTPNDKWIIIGCDGVFDMLSNERIASFSKTANSAAELACDLRNLAYAEMSLDNISVIVVDIQRRHVPPNTEHINDDTDEDILPQIPIASSFDENDFNSAISGSFPSFGSDTFGSSLDSSNSASPPHFPDFSSGNFFGGINSSPLSTNYEEFEVDGSNNHVSFGHPNLKGMPMIEQATPRSKSTNNLCASDSPLVPNNEKVAI